MIGVFLSLLGCSQARTCVRLLGVERVQAMCVVLGVAKAARRQPERTQRAQVLPDGLQPLERLLAETKARSAKRKCAQATLALALTTTLSHICMTEGATLF